MNNDFPITEAIVHFTALVSIALVVQLFLERIRIPGLIGLLLVGTLIGPGGFELMPREPVVELLGSLGLLYIMFLAGVEVDLNVVDAHKSESIGFGAGAFTLSFLPALAVGYLFGLEWPGMLLLAAALSSHTLIAYPIIERWRLYHDRPIVAAVGGTLVTDTLALIALVIVVQQAGEQGGQLGAAGPLLLLLALAALSLLLLPRIGGYFLERAGARPAEKALFVLAAMLLLSVAADWIGTEAILGAFLAGICLNRLVANRPDLRHQLEFVGRLLFVPFFFVQTGMRLELEVLVANWETWLLAGSLLGVVVLGKGAAALIGGFVFGYGRTAQVAMTGLTVPQAAATLAISLTAERLGLFPGEIVDAIIVVIFVTCLAGPIVTRYAARKIAKEKEKEA